MTCIFFFFPSSIYKTRTLVNDTHTHKYEKKRRGRREMDDYRHLCLSTNSPLSLSLLMTPLNANYDQSLIARHATSFQHLLHELYIMKKKLNLGRKKMALLMYSFFSLYIHVAYVKWKLILYRHKPIIILYSNFPVDLHWYRQCSMLHSNMLHTMRDCAITAFSFFLFLAFYSMSIGLFNIQ